MIIALDHDETFSRHPEFWKAFVALGSQYGHRVIGVTKREPNLAVDMGCEVFYTSRKSKRDHMNALGIHIDVWIDDSPESILFNDGIRLVQAQVLLG